MTKSHNYKMVALCLFVLGLIAGLWENSGSGERGGHLGVRTNDPRQHFTLRAEDFWRLRSPDNQRFDASGLVFLNHKLLTVNDRGAAIYEVRFGTNHAAELVANPLFGQAAVSKAAGRRGAPSDCEGLALDSQGRLYLSEESQRSIYRTPARGGSVELLPIDWAPVARFFKGGANASFEGVAAGGGKLYVANEREDPRIIVVDLETLQVEDSYFVDSAGFAIGGAHYSDLAWFEGRLFVLDRNHRCILEVNPATKKVEVEYAFGQMELAGDMAYRNDYPTGTMEGLAVDRDSFWLVTDNNGKGRFADRADSRPTLFRCARPRK